MSGILLMSNLSFFSLYRDFSSLTQLQGGGGGRPVGFI